MGKSIATAVIVILWRRGFVLGKMETATAMNIYNKNSNNPTESALCDIKGPSPQLADLLYTEPSSNQLSSVNSGGIGQAIEGVHPTVKGDLDNYNDLEILNNRLEEILTRLKEMMKTTRDLSKCVVAAMETHSKSVVEADENHSTSVVAELFLEPGITKEITLEPGII
jgi:hypothetical protein